MATKTNTTINGRSYYRIRRTIDGKVKDFYGKSKTDAERKYREYLEQIAEEKYQRKIKAVDATLGEKAEEYIENSLKVSQRYAKGTINRYIGEYERHIKGTDLADTPLKDVRPSVIQEFYNSLECSQHSIKELNKFFSGFSKWLVRNNYCDDIISAVEIPKKEDTSRHEDIIVWEDEEIRQILTAMDAPVRLQNRHRQVFLVHLLLYTGVRISEALGLKYSDIRDGIIHIDRQYYLGELKEPKWGSRRQIPMHSDLITAFEEHKEWHEYDMEKHHYKTDFVFTTSSGNLYHQASVRKALKRFYESNDIPYKHMHAYRATFCTNMCRCGVPLEVTSKLMGHKSLEVTAAHYALVRQDSMQDAIDKLHFNI